MAHSLPSRRIGTSRHDAPLSGFSPPREAMISRRRTASRPRLVRSQPRHPSGKDLPSASRNEKRTRSPTKRRRRSPVGGTIFSLSVAFAISCQRMCLCSVPEQFLHLLQQSRHGRPWIFLRFVFKRDEALVIGVAQDSDQSRQIGRFGVFAARLNLAFHLHVDS